MHQPGARGARQQVPRWRAQEEAEASLACSLRSASPDMPAETRSEPGDLTWVSHTASPPGLGNPPPPRDRELHQPGVSLTPVVPACGRSTAVPCWS